LKFCRIGAPGKEVPAILGKDGELRSLANIVSDIDSTFIATGFQNIADVDLSALPPIEAGRYGSCVAHPGKIVCVGLNYADHARESGLPLPKEPVLFMKACHATGPDDDIVIPAGALKMDWEAELAVVIGKDAYCVPEDAAEEYIAGYCILDDVSERSFQHERGGQWMKGKSSPGFAPLGPWLVTRDEVLDSGNLAIWLEVNGKRYQDGSTRDLVFSIKTIIAYASRFMKFYPGDVISTGTPAGVGAGLKPPVFLGDGDIVTLGIHGLGVQRHRFVSSVQSEG
jgi:2-keto-4-pentenoate hydratase/2-oxohepta-3-ene-1,7-dioic acid hydratase in catechol pathway